MVWQYEYFLKQINKQQLSCLIELVLMVKACGKQ